MLKKINYLLLTLVLLISLQPTFSNAVAVESNSTNSNYSIIIEDDADLLTEMEEQQLRTQMKVLTEFGHVMFKTTNTANGISSLRYIQNYYYSKLGNQSGVAFYIDMNKTQICACATGGLDRIITSSKCDFPLMGDQQLSTTAETECVCRRTSIPHGRAGDVNSPWPAAASTPRHP